MRIGDHDRRGARGARTPGPTTGEGMASGDVVNTAARLQAAAPVNGILVGETTYRATRARRSTTARPSRSRRRARPSPSRCGRPSRRASRFGIDARRGAATPLVGRERELDAARRRARRACARSVAAARHARRRPGHRQEPARLRALRSGSSRARARLWRQGRSLPYGEGVTLLGARRDRQGAGRHPRDRRRAQTPSEKLARASRARVDDDGAAGSSRTCGRSSGSSGERGGRPRDESFAAWRRFFEALAEQRPPVLVFEDLHWADDGLLDFVDDLADWATRRAAARRLHRAARAARPAAGLGRRQAQRVDDLALAALRRGHGTAVARCSTGRCCRPRCSRRCSSAPAATRSTRSSSRACSPSAARGRAAAAGDRPGDHRRPARRSSARARRRCSGRRGLGKVFWLGALASTGGAPRGRERSALARAQGVRPPRAPLVGRGRDRVRLRRTLRPRRRLRADPARRARPKACAVAGLDRARLAARRISPSSSRTTELACATAGAGSRANVWPVEPARDSSAGRGGPGRWRFRPIGAAPSLWRALQLAARSPAASGVELLLRYAADATGVARRPKSARRTAGRRSRCRCRAEDHAGRRPRRKRPHEGLGRVTACRQTSRGGAVAAEPLPGRQPLPPTLASSRRQRRGLLRRRTEHAWRRRLRLEARSMRCERSDATTRPRHAAEPQSDRRRIALPATPRGVTRSRERQPCRTRSSSPPTPPGGVSRTSHEGLLASTDGEAPRTSPLAAHRTNGTGHASDPVLRALSGEDVLLPSALGQGRRSAAEPTSFWQSAKHGSGALPRSRALPASSQRLIRSARERGSLA